MEQVEAAVGYAREHGARFVEELKDLLRIPSVSTLPEHAGDVRRAAEFCAAELQADWDGKRPADRDVRRPSHGPPASLRRLASHRGRSHGALLWAL